MTSSGKPGLVPKLRFPEFREAGDWQRAQLEDLISTVTPPKKIPTSDYLSEGSTPIIDQGQSDIAGWTNDPDSIVEASQPLIIFGDHTCALKLIRRSFAQGADGIKIIKGNGLADTAFLYQFLCFRPVLTEEYKRHFSILKTKVVTYPDLKSGEQQKIADCLAFLDELITLEAQKLDTLKTHKKGLMQQLFPAEGETLPKLRFPEFQGAGVWENKKLSSLIQLISGLHLSPDQYSNSGTTPYFTGPSDFTNEIQNVSKWTEESKCIARENDILITVKGSGVGEIFFLALQSVAMGRQLMAIHLKNGSSRFIYQFLLTKRTRFEDLASGNLIPGLSRGDILDLEAHFPSLPEQQKIADCLASLDNLITAQTQKLAALKTHKNGLMQQLFPDTATTPPLRGTPPLEGNKTLRGTSHEEGNALQRGGAHNSPPVEGWQAKPDGVV